MAAADLDEVVALYERFGGENYDEEISQLAHAEQTAALAAQTGASDAVIAAALLHDVGHLVYLSGGPTGPHEATGPAYLASLFGPEVLEPIGEHVQAKRCLCTIDTGYWGALSNGSKRSLKRQGGPLAPDEAQRYAAEHPDALALRRWDDLGKVDGLVVRPFADYRGLLESLVR